MIATNGKVAITPKFNISHMNGVTTLTMNNEMVESLVSLLQDTDVELTGPEFAMMKQLEKVVRDE